MRQRSVGIELGYQGRSCLISVTLGALALGYLVGGKAADRWPTSKLLYR